MELNTQIIVGMSLAVIPGLHCDIYQTSTEYWDFIAGLREFPDISDRGTLEFIHLSHNLIQEVNNNSGLLTGMDRLSTLELFNNAITTFPQLAEVGDTLQVLDLGSNQIQNISPDSLELLTAIHKLDLADNMFAIFPDLRPISQTLRWLSFSENNMHTIPNEALESLVSVEGLFLYENKLTEVPDINYAHQYLVSLDLEDNMLTEFICLNLTASVQELLLKNNNIRQITPAHYELAKDGVGAWVQFEGNPVENIAVPRGIMRKTFNFGNSQLTNIPACQLARLRSADNNQMLDCHSCAGDVTSLIKNSVCNESVDKNKMRRLDLEMYDNLAVQRGRMTSVGTVTECSLYCLAEERCIGIFFSRSHLCALWLSNNDDPYLSKHEGWVFYMRQD